MGGNVFISVTSGIPCVDLRQFYHGSRRGDKGLHPESKGIAITLVEWPKLAELLMNDSLTLFDANMLASKRKNGSSPLHGPNWYNQ